MRIIKSFSNRYLVYGMLVGAAARFVLSGTLGRAWNGFWNWNEHLYGHWYLWEEWLMYFGNVALLALGYFLGKYGLFYRNREDLPRWLKWAGQ